MGSMRLAVLLLALAGLAWSVIGFMPPSAGGRVQQQRQRQQQQRPRRRPESTTTTMMEAPPRSTAGRQQRRRQQQQQHQQTRKDVLAQGLLGVTAGALALGSAPTPAQAWCGKKYPSWAYTIPFNDGNFKVRLTGLPKLADVFLRVVGKEDKKGGVAPVIVFPTVGLAHDYLETLEALTYGDRQVITFDPVGVGQSSRELPEGLADASVGEEEALRRWSTSVVEVVRGIVEFLELGGKDLHLLGHGAGAIPALQYAAEVMEAGDGRAIKSLTLASPFVLGGKAVAKAYTKEGQTVPLCVSEAVDGFGKLPALAEAEGAEATFDARWASLPAFDKLAGVPTFVTYGSREPIGEKEVQKVVARVPQGTTTGVKRFEGTALPHVDQYEAYTDWVDENLQRSEGKMRPV